MSLICLKFPRTYLRRAKALTARCPLYPQKRTLELGRQISFCAKMQECSHLPGKWCSFILELPTDIPKLRELKGSDDAFGIPRTRLKACRRRWLLRRCP